MPVMVPPPVDDAGAQEAFAALARGGKVSRRRLLKWLGVGTLGAVGGVWLYRTILHLGPPAPGKVCFDADELRVCDAAAGALFPGPPDYPFTAAEIGVTAFADQYIGGFYPDQVKLFRMLLRALNLSPVLRHGRALVYLPLSRRQEVLEGWRTSDLLARRGGYSSLRFVLSMGYFEDARVRRALGFRLGCPLPGRDGLLGDEEGA